MGNSKTLGKYANGSTIPTKGKTLDEFLEDIVTESVPPIYVSPSVTISSNKSTTYEIGSNVGTVNLSNNYTKNNGGNVNTTTYFKNTASLGANVNFDNIPSLTSSVTYYVKVNYDAGPVLNDNLGNPYPTGQILAGSVNSSNLTITPFAYKYYSASATNSPTDAELIAANKEPASAKAKTNFSITVSGGSKFIFYAYPASLGTLTSINVGGLESLGVFTLITRNVTNASGYTQSYHIYTSNNSTSSSVSNITIN